MTVAQTSIDCYHSNTGHFNTVKELIASKMEVGKSYTRREIASICEIDYSCPAGRVNEMVTSGDLEECGKASRGFRGRPVGLVRLALVLQ